VSTARHERGGGGDFAHSGANIMCCLASAHHHDLLALQVLSNMKQHSLAEPGLADAVKEAAE
jgi:hypothetical protein